MSPAIDAAYVATISSAFPDLAGWFEELRPRSDLLLRPLRPEEVTDRYVAGINDPAVSRFLVSARSGRLTRESIVAFVQRDWQACDAVLFGVWVKGAHCGNVRLHAVTAQTAQIGIAIFDTAVQGRGVGAAVLAAVAHHAVDNLRIARIIAGIDRNNVASRKAFAAVGFRCVADDPAAEGSIWHYP